MAEEKVLTYADIVNLEPEQFQNYVLKRYISSVNLAIETSADAEYAAKQLQRISNHIMELSVLSTTASFIKREYKRNGNQKKYEDAVDKCHAIDSLSHAIDSQYKALSKSISVYMENHKEQWMASESVSFKRKQ